MWGLGKFLVGGLLGAIFGFLVSPKQAQRVRDALLSQSAAVGPVTSRALRSPEAAVVEVEPEIIGVSDIADLTLHYGDNESLSGAAVEDESMAAEVDVEFDESGLESEEAEPSIDPAAWAPASSHDAWSMPVAPEIETQEQSHLTTGWVLEPPEFEPDMEVPEFEPVATEPESEPTMAGWKPELTQSEPEPTAAGPTAAAPESELEAEAAEPESTLLESEPADADVSTEPEAEPDTELAVAELEPEPTAIEAESTAFEEEPAAAEMVAEPEPTEAEAEPTASEEEPTASEEQPTAAEMIAEPEEPVSVIEKVVEVQADPSPAVLSDLRARIEETRRRIQRELDQPFAPDTEVPVEERAPTFTEYSVVETEAEIATPVEYGGYAESTADEAEELGESAVEVEAPVVVEEPSPAVLPDEEEAASVLPDEEEAASVWPDEQEAETGPGDDAEAEAESTVGEDEPSVMVTDAESQFDHEAMRRRIEETRNRLKAKAFDAMMKGESALLARDFDGSAPTMPPQVAAGALDSEVAETIDTTLIEEDL